MFGQTYTESKSTVAKLTSIRTLLAISAQLGHQVRHMDVDTAFLNASISENIWVKVPDGTELPPGDDGIYKLKKSLYELKQAPREWNHCINEFLVKELHFERSMIFIRRRTRRGEGCNQVQTLSCGFIRR